jgi:hypothetical protein
MGSDELLLVLDWAEITDCCVVAFAVVVTLDPESQITLQLQRADQLPGVVIKAQFGSLWVSPSETLK